MKMRMFVTIRSGSYYEPSSHKFVDLDRVFCFIGGFEKQAFSDQMETYYCVSSYWFFVYEIRNFVLYCYMFIL